LHELGARVGLVQPTMSEEIKFSAEKMGTAGPTAKLNEIGIKLQENVAVGTETVKEMTETVKEKSVKLWTETQEKVQELNDKVMENLDLGWQKMKEMTPGPVHELGARVGIVQPTMAEEIKFGAEKMGTAGPTAKLNEMTETVKEKGAQVWIDTQEKVQGLSDSVKENLEFGRMKVMEATETPGPLHEFGARVGLVQPTMSEEIKFGAEKMGTAGPTAKLHEVTENVQEKGVQVWTKAQEKALEYNEKLKDNVELEKEKVIREIEVKKENVQFDTEKKETVQRLHIHVHNVEKEKDVVATVETENKRGSVYVEKDVVVTVETENKRGREYVEKDVVATVQTENKRGSV